MIIEIAKHERMSETGSSLIRLIQNNEMPMLDLMVREAVQNSLDAALPGEGHVQIDFSIRQFNRQQLSTHFMGVAERLNEVYRDEQYRLLEIRDSNTHGLKGPLHDGDGNKSEFGNLIKLIYQIGMPQQREGSGGSWGLGKTVYFRLGIGLVIYYSRVCEDGIYGSRLAACLVEDESHPNALLKDKGNHRGIAWWGQQATGTSTMPLTDEIEIGQILDILGASPYEGNETGTTIIIPFLKDDLKPEIADLENQEEQGVKINEPWWNKSDSDYIRVALQRWYAPRLMNESYPHGRWLRATVDAEGILPANFLSVFKTIQTLYNVAVSKSKELDVKGNQVDSEKIQCIPINLRTTFENGLTAGWIAFAKVSKADLLIAPPNNQLSPWVQVLGRDIENENNPALISFTRKPGMVVGYEYTGKWVEGIPKTSSDEYVIGLFVTNSLNPLIEKNPKNQDLPFLLEEYIRGCEKADHTSWADWSPIRKNPLILDRIQKNLVRIITKSYSEKPAQQAIKKDEILGKLLADVLLPPEGFGAFSNFQSTPLPPKPPGGSGPAGRLARFVSIAPPVYEKDSVRFDYELYSGKQEQSFGVNLKVLTESGDIDAKEWESDEGVGVQFPMSLHRFSVNSIGEAKQIDIDTSGQIILDENRQEMRYKEMTFNIQTSFRFYQSCGIYIQNATGKTLKGSIWVATKDQNIRAAFFLDTLSGGNNT